MMLSPRMGLVLPWIFATALATGCDARPNDLREWRASDHHGAGNQAFQAPGRQAAPPGEAPKAPESSLVGVVWQSQCALCHGPSGRGDGPQGPMLRATNFTLASWQEQTNDEQIAEAIVRGKGSMPQFEGLPPEVVSALVSHIRGMGPSRE